MKKIFYLILVVFVAFSACTKEIEDQSIEQDYVTVSSDAPTATLTFTATFPDTNVPTKATWGDTPVIDNMYVAVFGQSSNENGGSLQHWAPAKLTKITDANHTYTAEYEVTLPLSTEGREVHFIANYTSDTPPTFDREKQIITPLYTQNGNCAYWQRVSLPDGIVGELQSDGSYALDDATEELLSDVHLVRNFAKITVQPALESSEFTILGYTLINVPDRGSIAPMNDKSFATLYTEIGDYCKHPNSTETDFFGDLMTANYAGYMPDGTQLKVVSKPGDAGDPGEASMIESSETTGFYMYERPIPSQVGTQTAVICHIQWKSKAWFEENGKTQSPNYRFAGDDYYYKIEVVGSAGEYVPICRNIWYKLNLNELEGDGEQSYDDAIKGGFFGNVSASIETQTLNEITDNISTLSVNRMDYTAIDDGDQVIIYFRYKPDASSSYVTAEGSDLTITKRAVGTYSDAINTFTVGTTSAADKEYNGWGKITVNLADVPDEGIRRSALRIQGERSGKRVIYRDIIFTVKSPEDFLSTAEDVDVDVNNNVNVTVKLPEGLTYSVFPVQVKIEAMDNNLTTNSTDLPVGFGESAFSTTNPKKNSYYFIKTIQYSDYYHKNSSGQWVYDTDYVCHLKKTGGTDVKIKLSADYFNTKELY